MTTPKSKVPVSQQDQLKPYYKYYLEPLTAAAPEKYAAVLQGPVNPVMALSIHDRNLLFESGYLECETGYAIMPDGTGFVANLTPMPGVTAAMFDWWFAWHALDNLRYTIWDNEDHYVAESMQKMRTQSSALSHREKYWDTTHYVLEDLGFGPEPLYINFKHPRDLGFAAEKIGTPACATIVCAKGFGKGQPPFASPPAIMCHFMRETEDGVELRSRFWMGWTINNGRPVKELPDGMRFPLLPIMSLCLHNIKEYTNLATLLPKIYAEQKDNWEVPA